MNSVRKILASGLGTGYLPLAPGTWASAAVVGIFVAVALATALIESCQLRIDDNFIVGLGSPALALALHTLFK